MALRITDSFHPLHPEPTEQPRLLVVDDEVSSAQALQMYLTRQGYEVQSTYSGAQALKIVESYQPHLLILDLLMPDISGLEVVQRLRLDPRSAYLPVIMITAQDQERKRLQSMLSGADDYLAKPVNELELLVRVQALLRTKTHIDRLWEENSALLHDLQTRNAELERALVAVEEANLLKENILKAVSHEMGTPMLQIKTAVHLLVEDVRANDPNNKPAQLVTEATSRLEGIIKNFTALARAESLKIEPLILKESIGLAQRELERMLWDKFKSDRIQVDTPQDLPPLHSDKRAVARILTILLDNALKFDPNQGEVKISTQREGEKQVRVSVRDHGIGIPKDQQERIFEEFYQVDSSTTRNFGGSGLGLAVARLLAERLNTHIEVESAPNEGSTFSFLLSIAQLDGQNDPEAKKKSPDPNQRFCL